MECEFWQIHICITFFSYNIYACNISRWYEVNKYHDNKVLFFATMTNSFWVCNFYLYMWWHELESLHFFFFWSYTTSLIRVSMWEATPSVINFLLGQTCVNWWGCVSASLYFLIDLGFYIDSTFILFK